MIKNLLSDEEQPEPEPDTGRPRTTTSDGMLGLFDSAPTAENVPTTHQTEPVNAALPYEPESSAETMRRSGLAYSAGVAFAAAVIFMLILGWGADVLLGTSPWGIVGGIILGSIIGFVQLFRLTSQIFNK